MNLLISDKNRYFMQYIKVKLDNFVKNKNQLKIFRKY
jgi:hypothetical protein